MPPPLSISVPAEDLTARDAHRFLAEVAATHPSAETGAALAVQAARHAQVALADAELARADLLLALSRAPSHRPALKALARLELAAGRPEAAARCVARAAALEAGPFRRARLLWRAGRLLAGGGIGPAAARTLVGALRALPPRLAGAPEAVRPLAEVTELEDWLRDRLAEAPATWKPDLHLLLGRLLAPYPPRLDEALEHLAAAAAEHGPAGTLGRALLESLHEGAEPTARLRVAQALRLVDARRRSRGRSAAPVLRDLAEGDWSAAAGPGEAEPEAASVHRAESAGREDPTGSAASAAPAAPAAPWGPARLPTPAFADDDWTHAAAPTFPEPVARAATDALARARDALAEGDHETALALADAVAEEAEPEVAVAAAEMAADLLIDHLDDPEEGLDRLARLGRDRDLPVPLRRRVGEARVRLLERMPADAARDRALDDALADAAAVAPSPEAAKALHYRRGLLLAGRPETADGAAGVLEDLLADEPGNEAVLDALVRLHEAREAPGDLARVIARHAEALAPEAAAPWLLRLAGLRERTLGDAAGARAAVERCLARLPGHPPALLELARLARALGDVEGAVEALRARLAVADAPGEAPTLHHALGELLEAADRPDEAGRHYLRALEARPSARGPLLGLQRVATQLPDAAERARTLQLCADFSRAPEEAAALLEARGRILLYELADPEAARTAAEAALSIDPGHRDALWLLREIAEATGDEPARMADLLRREAWRARSPKEAADAFAGLGRLYAERLGDPDLARTYFARALESDGEHPLALSGLARLYLEAEAFGAALPVLERLRAAESAPPEVRAWATRRLAAAREAAGESESALAAYREVLAVEAEEPEALAGAARLTARLGDLDGAAEALAALAEVCTAAESAGAAPPEAPAGPWARLAALEARRGRPAAAAEAWQRVLDHDPEHREALAALAVRHEESGAFQEAATLRERLARLEEDPGRRAAALAAAGAFRRDRLGDLSGALACFHDAAALRPDDGSVQADRLAVARTLERWDEVRAAALACAATSAGAAAAHRMSEAAEAAEALGDADDALTHARSALALAPAHVPAVERVARLLVGRNQGVEAAEVLTAAAEAAEGDEARRWTLEAARLLAQGGRAGDAAAVLAAALARAPEDPILQRALAADRPPPAELAAEALRALDRHRHRLAADPGWLAAVECLARGAGDPLRALSAGSVLGFARVASPGLRARVSAARGWLPDAPAAPVPRALRQALTPPEVAAGAAFHGEAEALLLAHGRLPAAPPGASPDPEASEEAAAIARLLGLPAWPVLLDAGGSGLRPDPAARRLTVATDLWRGRLVGERRFVLAFGLCLCRPGGAWTLVAPEASGLVDEMRGWAEGRGPAPLPGLDEGAREVLAARLGPGIPDAEAWRQGVLREAGRLGLLATVDLAQGLAAAVRLLTGAPLPGDASAFVALAEAHPLLADLLAFVHGSPFAAARRAMGVAPQAEAA